MQRIRFLREEQYEHGGRRIGPVYAAGTVIDVRDQVARTWFRKTGAVEVVGDDVPLTEAPAPVAAPRAKRGRRTRVKR